eukprot:13397-Eustigmatos_ZCMA.PRE.1
MHHAGCCFVPVFNGVKVSACVPPPVPVSPNLATTNKLIYHACPAPDGASGELVGPRRQRRRGDDDVLWYFSFGANMAS